MAMISTPFQLSTQEQMMNKRKGIGSVICKLHGDDVTPVEEIIIATRNQWHCVDESLELDNEKFLF